MTLDGGQFGKCIVCTVMGWLDGEMKKVESHAEERTWCW